jgi:hypothetical protein
MKTLYDAVLVDCSCLYHKCKGEEVNEVQICGDMIRRIDEARKRCSAGGVIYLLFDPIPLDDLGVDKAFNNTGLRRRISGSYKKDRQFSPTYSRAINLFRRYYAYRGPSIREVWSDEYEADDYAFPILKLLGSEGKRTIAMWSTDMDWSRYILRYAGADGTRLVDLINGSWNKPATAMQFEKQFGFPPCPGANTLYKALFGDESDGIKGAITNKKIKFGCKIKTIGLEAVKNLAEVSASEEQVREVISFGTKPIRAEWPTVDFDRVDELFKMIASVDQQKDVMGDLERNVMLISGSCPDATPFITWNEEKPDYNAIMRSKIFGERKSLADRLKG